MCGARESLGVDGAGKLNAVSPIGGSLCDPIRLLKSRFPDNRSLLPIFCDQFPESDGLMRSANEQLAGPISLAEHSRGSPTRARHPSRLRVAARNGIPKQTLAAVRSTAVQTLGCQSGRSAFRLNVPQHSGHINNRRHNTRPSAAARRLACPLNLFVNHRYAIGAIIRTSAASSLIALQRPE